MDTYKFENWPNNVAADYCILNVTNGDRSRVLVVLPRANKITEFDGMMTFDSSLGFPAETIANIVRDSNDYEALIYSKETRKMIELLDGIIKFAVMVE